MTGPHGLFRSHPTAVNEMVRRSQYCSWLITLAEIYIVSLSLRRYISTNIYDGSNDTAPLLGTYCGSNATIQVKHRSSTNNLYIVSNSGSYARNLKNKFAFQAEYFTGLYAIKLVIIFFTLHVRICSKHLRSVQY